MECRTISSGEARHHALCARTCDQRRPPRRDTAAAEVARKARAPAEPGAVPAAPRVDVAVGAVPVDVALLPRRGLAYQAYTR
jgi:hypothetical protein